MGVAGDSSIMLVSMSSSAWERSGIVIKGGAVRVRRRSRFVRGQPPNLAPHPLFLPPPRHSGGAGAGGPPPACLYGVGVQPRPHKRRRVALARQRQPHLGGLTLAGRGEARARRGARGKWRGERTRRLRAGGARTQTRLPGATPRAPQLCLDRAQDLSGREPHALECTHLQGVWLPAERVDITAGVQLMCCRRALPAPPPACGGARNGV